MLGQYWCDIFSPTFSCFYLLESYINFAVIVNQYTASSHSFCRRCASAFDHELFFYPRRYFYVYKSKLFHLKKIALIISAWKRVDFHPRLILHVTTSRQLVKGVYKDHLVKFNASLNNMISFLIKSFFFFLLTLTLNKL